MSQFRDLIAQLEGFAATEWKKVEAEGRQIEQELVPVLEDGFAKAVADFGQLAIQLAVSFMSAEFAALTGGEKNGRIVTTLVQEAERQSKALAIQDAQALAKNAYLAVVGTAPG